MENSKWESQVDALAAMEEISEAADLARWMIFKEIQQLMARLGAFEELATKHAKIAFENGVLNVVDLWEKDAGNTNYGIGSLWAFLETFWENYYAEHKDEIDYANKNVFRRGG